MRYVTATVGAIVIFVAVMVISIVINSFLPAALHAQLAVNFGLFWLRSSPMLLVGAGAALLAATHSFRSTLKRYHVTTNAEHGDPEVSG
jgi:hypothetical protein